MEEYKTLDRIKDYLFAPYHKLEYYFAKRWLDRNFGAAEYWGDTLCDLFKAKEELYNQRIACKNTPLSSSGDNKKKGR